VSFSFLIQVCPWNRFDWPGERAGISPLFGRAAEILTSPDLIDLLLNIKTEEDFRARFPQSAIQRIGRLRFHRNVAIALGNSGDRGCIPALKEALANEVDDVVREHIEWAIDRLEKAEKEEKDVEADMEADGDP